MKTDDQDKLKSLFQEINMEEPRMNLESRIMQQVYIISDKKKQKNRLISILCIIGGLAAAIGIPLLVFRLYGFSIDKESLASEFSMPQMQFDPLMISIAGIAFMLLAGDLLIRKRIWNKKHKH